MVFSSRSCFIEVMVRSGAEGYWRKEWRVLMLVILKPAC